MKVLVTGATGYLGTVAAEALASDPPPFALHVTGISAEPGR